MHKFETFRNDTLGETTLKTTIENGLDIYICKKQGFEKKIGMFGTKYGSIINEFIDIDKNEKIKVPDGVAHFLEHKLFEQEDSNALDLFSKLGISSNAYTSFDQTVYYFETTKKFNEAVSLLIKLVKTPYFTKENVDKEQGIIGQEITMYDDDPNFSLYFNTIRAMYNNHPIRIDIAGTIDSIAKIDKDVLYTCYNTFYNNNNMFFLVVGDVNENEIVDIIEDNMKLYTTGNQKIGEIKKFLPEEPNNICKKEIIKKMDIFMPEICIGYKLDTVKKDEIIKRQIIADFINEIYFSRLSNFFEEMYNKGLVIEPISFDYEGSDSFSHVLISSSTTNIKELKENLIKYIDDIVSKEVDEELFDLIKKRKIGETIFSSESLSSSYRRIINSIIDGNKLYIDIELINNITSNDIKEFLNKLDGEFRVCSIIDKK